MTNDFLYEYIVDYLRKDRRGKFYSEADHNRELQRMNIMYMDSILPLYEVEQDITDKLEQFKTVIPGISLTVSGNLITKPTDYALHDELTYKQDGDSTKVRPFDFTVGSQWGARRGSSVSAPSERFPIGRYRGGYIEFLPTTLTQNYLEYSYIRYPIEPVYDGYYDANGNFIYMPPGTPDHTLLAGEVGLDGTASGAYSTSSVELEWHDDDKLIIADMIIRSLGIVIKDPLITQFKDQVIKEK
jgi:hypothetical protein